jgi:hypothetical protein
MSVKFQPLQERLEKAKFTGELYVRFESGQPASVRLTHFLPLEELDRELVTVEPEKEFPLKP